MGLLERIEEKSFLGEEFLTWLLWRSEARNGLIGVGAIEVNLGGAVVLSAPFGDAEEVALKGENPAASRELLAALREGKLVSRAQMRWVVEGVEWNVTVRGATLALGGLRPPLRSAPLDAGWIERRLELLEQFSAALDQVFEAFLALRLSDRGWKREIEAMRAWVASEPEISPQATEEAVIEIRDEE